MRITRQTDFDLENGINTALINACASGDRNAQRQLYAVLMPFLNMVCRRYLRDRSEAQDVLQETFVRIFTHIRQYDAGKSSLRTWASRIAINYCLKHNAARQRNATDEYSPLLHDLPVAPEALKNLDNEELLEWLRAMPEAFAQVFNLYVIDGFSHEEIGEMLGIEPALSRQRLSRGRDWLRKGCAPDLLFLLEFATN